MAPETEKKQWPIEEEGRLAACMRMLAAAESAEERESVVTDLKEVTGLDFGNDMKHWLAWYLEEHLGMRNAVGILAGREISASYEGKTSLTADEMVFDRAEYNWCALEKIKNKDDMVKLRMLYSDLECPLHIELDGPFSFRRLVGLDDDDLSFFEGKTISQALFADDVQVRHLKVLKDYGKMMMMPVFPSATQRTGAILYAASISQALVKYDVKITSLSYADLKESLPGLLERPYLVESFADLFVAALDKCV